MGDQSNEDDFQWIDEVGIHHVVDVLMPNCWTTDIAGVAKGFNPAIIITGHENEMGHTIIVINAQDFSLILGWKPAEYNLG